MPKLQRLGCILLPMVGGILAGFMFHWIVLRPGSRVIAARDWVGVPCRIASSDVVRVENAGTQTRYRADVRFRYSWNGRHYSSNRLEFMSGSTSRYPHQQESIVARYPRGSTATCYVNPARPHEAVLHRGFPSAMWWGLLPFVLLLLSIFGLAIAIAMEWFERTK
jgi:Protein of unknown function (DUF3592)